MSDLYSVFGWEEDTYSNIDQWSTKEFALIS